MLYISLFISYLLSRPLARSSTSMVWEGKDVIRQGRRIVGATNPLESDPGSIRGQYAVSVGRNIIHASDAHDSATKEIGLWYVWRVLLAQRPPKAFRVLTKNASATLSRFSVFRDLSCLLSPPHIGSPRRSSPSTSPSPGHGSWPTTKLRVYLYGQS